MIEKNDHQTEEQELKANAGPEKSRRRFLAGGLATAPVIVTLSSRPAWANRCSISGWGSINPSLDTVNLVCFGRSPGFWKFLNNTKSINAWNGSGWRPGPGNLLASKQGAKFQDYSIASDADLEAAVTAGTLLQAQVDAYRAELLTAPGTTFDEALNFSWFGNGTTLMQVLHTMEGSAEFHYTASLLNAAYYGESYGYTLDQMRTLIQDKHATGINGFALKDILQDLYDRPGSDTM